MPPVAGDVASATPAASATGPAPETLVVFLVAKAGKPSSGASRGAGASSSITIRGAGAGSSSEPNSKSVAR